MEGGGLGSGSSEFAMTELAPEVFFVAADQVRLEEPNERNKKY